MNFLLVFLIQLYQKTLSPDHGWFSFYFPCGCCRFHPSCSEYAIEALKQKSFWRALGLIFWRILRCNPFTSPTIDPIIKLTPKPIDVI